MLLQDILRMLVPENVGFVEEKFPGRCGSLNQSGFSPRTLGFQACLRVAPRTLESFNPKSNFVETPA